MGKNGTVRQMSPTTDVLDCGDEIKKYLRSINHRGANIGKTVVWVRYGRKNGRRSNQAIAVGPTRESVEVMK